MSEQIVAGLFTVASAMLVAFVAGVAAGKERQRCGAAVNSGYLRCAAKAAGRCKDGLCAYHCNTLHKNC